jgi:hypothetical protein
VTTNCPLAAPGLALSAFLALLLASAVLGQEPVMYGRVVGVTDRDSLKILVAEQQLLRVRIAICDASEKRQPFGMRAKQAMRCMSFEFFGFFTFGPFFVTVAGSTILEKKGGKEILRGSLVGEKK